MPQLINLVIHDSDRVDDVVHAWLGAGITGLTLVDTCGLTHHMGHRGLRDDVPLFPSLRSLLEASGNQNRMLFALVADDFDTDELIRQTETVLGSLDSPGTGILFVMPVTRVVGLQPPPEA